MGVMRLRSALKTFEKEFPNPCHVGPTDRDSALPHGTNIANLCIPRDYTCIELSVVVTFRRFNYCYCPYTTCRKPESSVDDFAER